MTTATLNKTPNIEKLFRTIADTDEKYAWLINWLACRAQTGGRSEMIVQITGDYGGTIYALLEVLLENIFKDDIVIVPNKSVKTSVSGFKRSHNVIVICSIDDTLSYIPKKHESFNIAFVPLFRCDEIESMLYEIPAFVRYLQGLEINHYAYHRHIDESGEVAI